VPLNTAAPLLHYTRGHPIPSPTTGHTPSTNNVISGKEFRVSDLHSATSRVT